MSPSPPSQPSDSEPKPATFNPDAFRVTSLAHAMEMTVGPLDFNDGEVVSAEAHWALGTDYAVDLIARCFRITAESVVLDYGCGTGRVAKALIERFGCHVVGVDSSESMRGVAGRYVNSPNFRTCKSLTLASYRALADSAICLWVLQHAEKPWEDAERIYATLKPGGRLLVCNENMRHLPTYEYGFADDRLDVRGSLRGVFGEPVASGRLDPAVVHPKFSERTSWGLYRRGWQP